MSRAHTTRNDFISGCKDAQSAGKSSENDLTMLKSDDCRNCTTPDFPVATVRRDWSEDS